MKLSRCVLISVCIGIFPLGSFGQDNSGNATTPSGNVSAPSPDAVAAIQQQRQQATQQFMQQLSAASPDDKAALIANFRQQMDVLTASLVPPPLTPDQQAQATAQIQTDQQTFAQSLPPDTSGTVTAMQQRQQLAQQLATATPDQKVALIAQIQQLVAQQDQTIAAQIAASASGTASVAAAAQMQAQQLAALPADQQATAQAMIQRQQAIDAAMQLSPDQRVTAIQAIRAQPLPVSASNSTTGTDTGNTASTTSNSQP